MIQDEDKVKVAKEKQLSGSMSDGGISFRQWDKNAKRRCQDDRYLGKETIMPMWCAPISTFSWVDNQCQETLRWENDPENDSDGNPIEYNEVNQRWMSADKPKIWMEFVVEVSTKSATRVNAAPPKWTASHCSLSWQSQLAANRDEAVKNYCKSHTRKASRDVIGSWCVITKCNEL